MAGVQIGVPLIGSLLAAALYAAGRRRADDRRRALLFATALATVVVALASPLDDAADKLFWAHMVQHMVLMMVTAPLLVLSCPWLALWRPLPLSLRRPVARAVVRSPALAPVRWLRTPVGAAIAFNVVLWVWHLPALYDLTLRNQAVHDLEHLLMLVTAVLLWSQLIDSPPLHARLDAAHRCLLAFVCALSAWVLALVLTFWPSPLYDYAELAHRPGGISAMTDQQLAAGVMIGPGSVSLAVIILVLIDRMMDDDQPARPGLLRARPRAVHATEKGVRC